MEVLILNPPNRYSRYVNRDLIYGCWCKGKRIANALFPPLNLLYIATVLKEGGFSVELLDALGQRKSLEDAKKIVMDKGVLILFTDSTTFNEDKRVIKELKIGNPNLKIVMCGPYPTVFPELALKKSDVDFVISGEAEIPIKNLMINLRDENRIKNVSGISWKENGKLKVNKKRSFVENLDDLPFPDRNMLKGKYYNPLGKKEYFTTSLTSRGCNGTCIFCSSPSFYGNRIRCRSAGNVIEELKLIKNQGYNDVLFRDETFTIYRKRNEKICKTIIKENLDISWICNLKIGTINKKTMLLMKRSGCHYFKIGVESGSQRILNNLEKGITIKRIEKTFRLCKEVGINTHAHLMLGSPGENEKTVEKTIRFLKRIEPDTIDVGVLTAFPGTKVFEMIKSKTDKIRDGTSCGIDNIHTQNFFNEFICELSKEELEESIKKIYREFYIRPRYVVKKLSSINSFNDFVKNIKNGINILQFSLRK